MAKAGEAVRVVIADDHEVVRKGLATLLEGSDVKIVGEATTGEEAIKLTRKHWECAGITDKDTRSRVIAKITRECPGILLDAQRGRCTSIEFKRL